jgi:SOS-response transcriptional repressor LexA
MPAGDTSDIYDDLMRFKPEGITLNAWAMKAGVSRTVWSDMRRHGNPSRRTLDKLLTAVGSSLAEFEALRVGAVSPPDAAAHPGLSERRGAWGAAQLPALAVVDSAMGGEWGEGIELTELRTGEIVDRVARPPSLAGDPTAYAVTIVGDSMWPRFRPGRRIAVSSRSPVAIGDDVLVKLNRHQARPGTTAVLIKELVRRSSSAVELRQFNPDRTFEVAPSEIAAIEKVLGELV